MPIFPVLPDRVYRISAANVAMTVSTEPVTPDRKVKLTAVYIAYDAAVTLSATITLNSGLGAAYDTRLATLPFVGDQWGFWVPDTPIPLGRGDAIDVLAPAGGGTIASAVQILTEEERPVSESQGWDYEQIERE